MASPEFYRLVERMRARASPGVRPIAVLREEMEEVGKKFRLPADVVFAPVEANGVPCEWTTPPNAEAGRTILYFHGGG